MTIYSYEGLTRNPEIPSSEFCSKSWDWGKLWILNLARIPNKILLHTAKWPIYSFYRFSVIKGKRTEREKEKKRGGGGGYFKLLTPSTENVFLCKILPTKPQKTLNFGNPLILKLPTIPFIPSFLNFLFAFILFTFIGGLVGEGHGEKPCSSLIWCATRNYITNIKEMFPLT